MKKTIIRSINFIEFNARINTLGSLGPLFPKYGSLLLASRMRDLGYPVRYFLEGISSMDFDTLTDADCLCLSVFAPALNKVRALARRARQEKPSIPVILGGPQVCFFPDTVLDCCTCAVRCEGDEVLPRLVECLNGGGDFRELPGISFRDNGKVVHTPEGPPPEIPATIPDITLIEGYERAAPRIMGRSVIINTLQTTRGCRFRCKFCPTHKLFQGTYRSRSIDDVVADIRKRLPYDEQFFVVDNDFCSDRRKSKALLQRLVEENLGARFIIFERHEIGRDEEMLKLLARAGVKVVIVGVESLSDKSLEAFNKKQTAEEVLKSIRNIQAQGMRVLSTFVLGYDEDTPAEAERLIGFVRDNRLVLNLFILHDLEHDETKDLLIPLRRRFMTYYGNADPDNMNFWDYMTGSFVTYFPKRMKPSTLQRLLFHINDRAYSHGSILKDAFSPNLFRSFFGVSFGYRMKRINRNLSRYAEKHYLDYLKRIEEGLYDEKEELIEEKLSDLAELPAPPAVVDYEERPFYDLHTRLALLPAFLRFTLAKVGRG
ncbi:MAG: B12-binding domain-containing radical SAM protein [Deltaproteobacteria bacterium]|nr:B12-binding domain-containing radical SAM protein [Deltaproteobacteria bacterium]